MSKHLYPDNERVEDTDIFDSSITTVDEADPDNSDQDLVDNEPSEGRVETVQSRNRPQERTPETDTRIENPQLEIKHNDFRPRTVHFGTQEELILPPPRDESRIRVPLRDEPHKNHSQQTQRRTDDEGRKSSSPSRNNQSWYILRENPTPKTYPDFLIHDITTARTVLRKTNNVNLTI